MLPSAKSSGNIHLLRNQATVDRVAEGVTLMEAAFADHSFARHSHDGFAIGVTTHGIQRFRCKGRQHDSLPGDFVLFNPDDDHDGQAGSAEGFRYLIWYVPEALVRASTGEDERERGRRYFVRPHARDTVLAERFQKLSRSMLALPSESLRNETLVSGVLRSLLQRHGQAAGTAAGTVSAQASAARLASVKDYIRAYYASDISVSDLAAVAGLSRVHLTRAFSSAYHMPPHVYLNAVRIARAQQQIGQGRALAEVALDCGFVDQSHLTRRFKACTGVTPSQWKAATNKGHRPRAAQA
ncbi:AraC family transcriptional regulator [Herbaspirillum huttiense]|uniref:AraC family transcriptional regulator n=2 Tax=Pseudomonadota TaxID=1224 RepID=UPI002E766D1E|nr:AraC family transcriptional regulator [Herbaspirillum huttiense]MEE1638441.1 AraC family transcriptional regulator [Herbaspirillum huttiense NC40101]